MILTLYVFDIIKKFNKIFKRCCQIFNSLKFNLTAFRINLIIF